MKLNKVQFNKWLKALRSGKYRQTCDKLQDDKGYCCLGVACQVLIPKDKQVKETEEYYDGSKLTYVTKKTKYLEGTSPRDQKAAPAWLKKIDMNFQKRFGCALSELNDDHQLTFKEIADLLEQEYLKGGVINKAIFKKMFS